MAGKALGVNGPMAPSTLGATIMHEHLFIDFWLDKQPRFNQPASESALWDQKLTLENLHLARERNPIKDNYILGDVGLAIREAFEFRKCGGQTIVDVTSIGLGRDPLALRAVANATGLNIVMGAGWYQKVYHPADMDKRTVDDLTDEIVSDIVVGVNGTGIRSGIIGEVGINGDPITPNEVKSIQASARASRATGAAISFHAGGRYREKFQVATLVGESGGDLTRTIFGHSNSYAHDVPFLLELLSLGVYVQFDTLGRVAAMMAAPPIPPGPVDPAAPAVPFDAYVAAAIPKLIDAGYADKLLLSQDVCTKTHLKAYGGTGYSFVMEKFVPYLRSQGVAESNIHKMMVENPQRVLTFVSPEPV
jgi:phosphotriesterase-related protein